MGETVSIIMSVYNEDSQLVKEAIESVLSQTYKDIEYIIVLDNPTNEDLKQLLKEYSLKDSRIKTHFNKQNVGLVQSLNTALTYCTGKYIARMDADDISLDRRIELQKKYLEDNNFDFIFSNVRYIDEFGGSIGESKDRELSHDKLKLVLENINISNHPTWFLKKEVYDSLNGYRDIPYCEDYDFTLRSLESYKIGKLNIVTLLYRVRTNSISRSNSLTQFLNMYIVSKMYRKNRLNDMEKLQLMLDKNKKKITRTDELKFAIASEKFDQATKYFEKGSKLRGVVMMLRVVLKSKFYLYKLYKLWKHQMILRF